MLTAAAAALGVWAIGTAPSAGATPEESSARVVLSPGFFISLYADGMAALMGVSSDACVGQFPVGNAEFHVVQTPTGSVILSIGAKIYLSCAGSSGAQLCAAAPRPEPVATGRSM